MKEIIEEIKNKLGFENTTFSIKEKELIDIGLKDAIRILEKLQEEENKPFDPLQLSDEFIDCGLIELDEGNFYCWSLFLDGLLYLNKKYDYLVIYQNKNDLYTFALEFDEERQLKEPNIDIVKDVRIPNHRFGEELLKNLGVIE